jgi:hypothetical protein
MKLALHILRQELTPLSVKKSELHELSSFMMCSSFEELKEKAKWDGSSGDSRSQLLSNLQRTFPHFIFILYRIHPSCNHDS